MVMRKKKIVEKRSTETDPKVFRDYDLTKGQEEKAEKKGEEE